MLTNLRMPKTLQTASINLGAYWRDQRFHLRNTYFIAPQPETRYRSIGWASGVLLFLNATLPDGRSSIARIYCKDAESVRKVQNKLSQGELLPVKMGFQITRAQWSLIPQV